MRTCPFDGCEKRIRPTLFACARHWHSLRADLQKTIWEAYGSWQAGDIGILELKDIQDAVLASHRKGDNAPIL